MTAQTKLQSKTVINEATSVQLTSGSLWIHLLDRSSDVIPLKAGELSIEKSRLSGPITPSQKFNAHEPNLAVKHELYISNAGRASVNAFAILSEL